MAQFALRVFVPALATSIIQTPDASPGNSVTLLSTPELMPQIRQTAGSILPVGQPSSNRQRTIIGH
jgi:hypothetical protein